METNLRICVRLPNWLGDTVMSLGFMHLLHEAYPNADVSVIIKKGLEGVISLLPDIKKIYLFSKEENKGLRGVWNFGRKLKSEQKFDLFFVLPDSFSSAVMAFGSGAKKRVGFRAQGRNFLLTHTYKKPSGKHRVEEYAALMQLFKPELTNVKPVVRLPLMAGKSAQPYLIINTNSESVTSRLPVEKAVELISVFQQYNLPVKLIGGKKEVAYVNEIFKRLPHQNNTEVLAGKTNLQELIALLQGASFVISSDSGPAHIASASGVPLVVVTGAGDERNTGPYDNDKAIAVRNGKLPCEPCVKNYCKLSPLPQCLVQLDLQKVKAAADNVINELLRDE